MEIERPGRRKRRSAGERLNQDQFIRLECCGDFHAVACAALFQDDGINAEFRADLRHGFGHIRAVKNLEPHSSAAPSRGRQVRRGLRHLKRPNSTNARARMDFGMRQHRG